MLGKFHSGKRQSTQLWAGRFSWVIRISSQSMDSLPRAWSQLPTDQGWRQQLQVEHLFVMFYVLLATKQGAKTSEGSFLKEGYAPTLQLYVPT
jgi:hypothetical protein